MPRILSPCLVLMMVRHVLVGALMVMAPVGASMVALTRPETQPLMPPTTPQVVEPANPLATLVPVRVPLRLPIPKVKQLDRLTLRMVVLPLPVLLMATVRLWMHPCIAILLHLATRMALLVLWTLFLQLWPYRSGKMSPVCRVLRTVVDYILGTKPATVTVGGSSIRRGS